MMTHERLSQAVCCLLAPLWLAALCFFALPAYAGDALSADLTIEFPVSGATFSAYKVAVYAQESGYAPTGAFAENSESWCGNRTAGWTAKDWETLAQTLAGQAVAGSVKPTATLTSGAGGELTLDGLPYGLYLITGTAVESEGYLYTPAPFLAWLFEDSVEVNAKYSRTQPKPTEYEVYKVWKDNGDLSRRPPSIEVDLYLDETLVERVTLSEANNWHYRWQSDQAGHWQVVEHEIPAGYTATVTQEGTGFILTNTLPTPSPTPTPAPAPSTTPPPPPPTPKLPQTGLLLWPVPVLAGVGVACLLAGLYGKRRKRHEKD